MRKKVGLGVLGSISAIVFLGILEGSALRGVHRHCLGKGPNLMTSYRPFWPVIVAFGD